VLMANEFQSFFKCFMRKSMISRSGDLVAGHEFLGKVLAAFKCRALLGWPYYENMARSLIINQKIPDSPDQGFFGSYHYHLYFVGKDKVFQPFKIGPFYIDVLGNLCSTRISRCHV